MRLLLGLVIAGFISALIPQAHAEQWCGFIDKVHSQVRCGYSSLADCKQALADKNGDKKDAVCIPDPAFASLRHGPILHLAVSQLGD
jgi:hypothetical protein